MAIESPIEIIKVNESNKVLNYFEHKKFYLTVRPVVCYHILLIIVFYKISINFCGFCGFAIFDFPKL